MLGNRLKKLRLEKKLTQLQIAQKVNISEARYNLYENNKRQPDYELLKNLAEVLETTTDYLLGNDNTTKTINSVIPDNELADKLSVLIENEHAKVLFDKLGELSDEELNQVADIVNIVTKIDKTKDTQNICVHKLLPLN